MPKQIRLNAFDMNCVAHQSPGPVDASARPRRHLQHARLLDRPRAHCWSAGSSTRCSSPTCSASTTSIAARRDAALRRRGAGAGERSAAAGPGDGGGHRASRLRRHLHAVLRASVPVRPAHEHARPSDQRADRLEHRHRLSRTAPRRAWGMARQEGHDTRYEIAEDYMQVVYKLWEASWEDGAVLRDRASGRFADPAQDPPGRARRPVFPPVDAIHLARAVAAAHAGAVPGGRLDARPAIRRRSTPNACSSTAPRSG